MSCLRVLASQTDRQACQEVIHSPKAWTIPNRKEKKDGYRIIFSNSYKSSPPLLFWASRSVSLLSIVNHLPIAG